MFPSGVLPYYLISLPVFSMAISWDCKPRPQHPPNKQTLGMEWKFTVSYRLPSGLQLGEMQPQEEQQWSRRKKSPALQWTENSQRHWEGVAFRHLKRWELISRHCYSNKMCLGFLFKTREKESVSPDFGVILNSFYSQTSLLGTFKLLFRANDKICIKITNNSNSTFPYDIYSGSSWRNSLQLTSVRSVAVLLMTDGWRWWPAQARIFF